MTRKIDIEALCADKGLRITEQRRTIARVLSEAEDHPDVETLHERAAAVDPKISIATVYRTVRLFEEAGILERHEFGDGRSRYEAASDAHHDHLIDVETGNVIEFVDEQLETLHSRAAEIDPNISIATVYRTVRLFEEAGILERHEFGDGRSRYEAASETHHDHLIDVETGNVIEFVDEELELLQKRIAEKLGFRLVDHRMELYGVAVDRER